MRDNLGARSPIYTLPMSQTDFQMAQQTACQQAQLQPDVIRDELRHRQAMERAQQKSQLRQLEVLQKQKARQRDYQVTCENNSVSMSIISGTNVILAQKRLFRCKVTRLKCYQYDYDGYYYWQITLTEQDGNSEVVSELYDSNLLTSPSKLHNTILSKYICAYDKETCFYAWRWMCDLLNALYEDAEIIELPYRAGWFRNGNSWYLWSNSEDEFLLSSLAEKFTLHRFENLDVEETILSFLNAAPCISDERSIPAVLWIYRVAALLGRLTEAMPLGIGLTLIGERSRIIAEKFVRVMDNNMDVVSLDSCSLSEIRKTAKLLQDTPMIFVSSNPNSRSTKNRIEEVHGWIDTGYIGDGKVALPFVFCLQKFAKEYPLDGTVIIDSYKIKNLQQSMTYLKMQSLIISTIESAGTFWVDELKNEYAQQVESENTAMALYKAVDNIVLAMYKRQLSTSTRTRFEALIRLGEEEIERQLSLKYGILLEAFRKNVWQLVDNNALSVAGRSKCSNNPSDMQIFYDDMFYYFTRKVFDFVCQKANIDTKTELAIKQQLVECEYVKTYKNSGAHNRELEVDITIYTPNGQKTSISALAIEREFFDELGGVALFERGKDNET